MSSRDSRRFCLLICRHPVGTRNNTDSDTVSTPTCTINAVAGETAQGTSGADVILNGDGGDDTVDGVSDS